ncbi:hypothetical protein F5884DRAFT_811822 [Xylogone sp. PMI_703]|nr:hypothetical protein F5884DRAFT_811822 [Xylogone sp. PMI_703]
MAITQCEICHERSTWNFLHDFYLRVDSANEHARRLESDLHEANSALRQCEASLIASIERNSHQDTTELLERVFREAIRSGEIADSLSSQVAIMQASSQSGIVQEVLQSTASTEAPMRKERPIERFSSNQPRNLIESLPEPQLSGVDNRQQATHRATNPPGGPARRFCSIAPAVPLQSIETQPSTSSVISSTSTSEGVESCRGN